MAEKIQTYEEIRYDKRRKKFPKKYKEIMGESGADKLWNEVQNGIDEFRGKICI